MNTRPIACSWLASPPLGRKKLIEGATELLGRHEGLEGRIPAYVVIREVPEADWGIFGKQGDLEALRHLAADLQPL